ncbi:MAG TPA: hypothetical protein PLR20_14880 [Syntrophales bacterium]|nr:hypothetical protein [Syntrophales bacterium]
MIRKGDVFAVKTNSALAGIINFCQKVWSWDSESKYNHAGVIIDETGKTFESLAKIGSYDLSQYEGQCIIIARHKEMDDSKFEYGFLKVKGLDGAIYPVLRLLLHLVRLAKYIHWKYPVCSELVGKFLNAAGLWRKWWGITPDILADVWTISKHYDVIYEGPLEMAKLTGGERDV